MVGPAFGIDINENLRFQTGLGFHYLLEKSVTEILANKYVEEENRLLSSISLHSFGLGLTPQLRFSPSEKKSLIIGCDVILDFGRAKNSSFFYFEDETGGFIGEEIRANQIQKYFRFGMSPYIGVGINF